MRKATALRRGLFVLFLFILVWLGYGAFRLVACHAGVPDHTLRARDRDVPRTFGDVHFHRFTVSYVEHPDRYREDFTRIFGVDFDDAARRFAEAALAPHAGGDR